MRPLVKLTPNLWRCEVPTEMVEIQNVWKDPGQGQYGSYVRYSVVVPDGRRFVTFQDTIGLAAEALRGQKAQIDWHEDAKGTRLDAVRHADGQHLGYGGDPVGVEGKALEGWRDDSSVRSDGRTIEELRRTDAMRIAARFTQDFDRAVVLTERIESFLSAAPVQRW